MFCRHNQKNTLHVLLGTVLACGIFMGMDLREGYANPQSNSFAQAQQIAFQPRMSSPSSARTVDDDLALFGNLLNIEPGLDVHQILTRTESIQLSTIQSPQHPNTRVARRLHFQQVSGTALPMADLYFDFTRVRLGNDLIEVLHTSVDFQSTEENGPIFLEAYCDQRGGLAYSLALAARRMELVRKYFLDLGVSPHNVQVMNYGSLRPACQESMAQCQRSNTRIQSTFKFFAILEPQFGCLTRIKVAHSSRVAKRGNLSESPLVHRQIRLAPLVSQR